MMYFVKWGKQQSGQTTAPLVRQEGPGGNGPQIFADFIDGTLLSALGRAGPLQADKGVSAAAAIDSFRRN
jgi:hypothetical protein